MYDEINLNKLISKACSLKILYVEDDKETLKQVTKLLKVISENILTANNGNEALDIFKNNQIDILITDITMPKMNGIELIKEIKDLKINIPTVILSAYTDQKNIIDAIKAGIDGFIFKPIQSNQFFETIEKVVNQACIIKENEKNIAILKQYQDITNKSSIISKTDPSGIITFVNSKFCEISGYSEEELIGRPHSIVRHPDNSKELFEGLWNTIKVKKKAWSGIIRNLSKDGKSYFVKSTIKPLLDQDGEIIEFMALRNDVTQIMSERKQLLAHIDSQVSAFLALIQIENFDILDKFYDQKSVDKIETIFESKILSLLPDEDISFEKIFRLGNGLFAISIDYNTFVKKEIDIESYLKKFIQDTKDSTINLENIEYDIEVIVSYAHGCDKTYENAKYGIEKALKENRSLIFANNLIDEVQKSAQKNIETMHMVKKALDNFNIVSYFQPIIKNSTKQIVKYESLVRLIDEDNQVISPYFFLDVSKKGTYYTKITNRVIESSFKVLDHIKHNVSINLSVLDIENEAIRKKLIELVTNKEYKGRVTFELLEDENIKDFQLVKDFIALAKKEGHVKIAIDDFGSGYSNFERLLDYTPDILKIDGSLIKNIENDMFSKNIVETIVTFAKKQNIETIAEFVENENIYNILTQMGVDYSQGFYFGKPERII